MAALPLEESDLRRIIGEWIRTHGEAGNDRLKIAETALFLEDALQISLREDALSPEGLGTAERILHTVLLTGKRNGR